MLRQALVTLAVLSTASLANAQSRNRDNDPRLLEIYPYRPFAAQEIRSKVARVSEEARPVMNVHEIDARQLTSGTAATQPWAGPYWPLIQGQIANTYQTRNYIFVQDLISWRHNVDTFKRRRERVLPNVLDLSEQDLAKLAPSEKYDLLLGDTNFDLTSRIWNFVESWGNEKMTGFISSIDMPEGYRLTTPSTSMAFWEGICHGWALAAGGHPRPENTVTVTLPNGKRLPFYPTDLKALVSLAYANSLVQDNVLMEGLRCNDSRPRRDSFGRYVDRVPERESEAIAPRCADVHPAVWHLSMVHIMGMQRRSFVVEKDAPGKVNNHPVSGYTFRYFNPKTGGYGPLARSIVNRLDYPRDPYAASREASATSILGVEMRYSYTDWTMFRMDAVDSPRRDPIKSVTLYYDLELDAQGNVVGGQWRVNRLATPSRRGGGPRGERGGRDTTRQPDFFWVLPKNYMTHFRPVPGLGNWDPTRQPVAPQAWKNAARTAHAFTYQMTRQYGFDEKCTVIGERDRTVREVPCEYRVPRPQPLLNVVEKLLELSRQPQPRQ